ncbi:MAG TPA: pantetheine-phosphate adenylyltransferase [Bellilinea sp.]|mgnify:CR=1 FL=1|nr:pantetheine-phosphate adenylyltransferase [Bellilinea sp.]
MVKAVFPGSFDPIHYGHIDIAQRAAGLFDEVIVAVYDKPLKHLIFTPEERMSFVRKALNGNPKFNIMGYSGLTVEFCARVGAQVIVRGLRVFSDFEYEFKMTLANKRLHPEIETIAFMALESHTFLSSSTVREIASLGGDVSSMVPPFVEKALIDRYNELGDGSRVTPGFAMKD